MFRLFKKNFNHIILLFFVYVSFSSMQDFTLFSSKNLKDFSGLNVDSTSNNKLMQLKDPKNKKLVKKNDLKEAEEKSNIEIVKFSSPNFFSDSIYDDSISDNQLEPVNEKILFSGVPSPLSKPMPKIYNYTKHISFSIKNEKKLFSKLDEISQDMYERDQIMKLVIEDIDYNIKDNLKISYSIINGSEKLSEITVFKDNIHEVNARKNNFNQFVSQYVRAPTERRIIKHKLTIRNNISSTMQVVKIPKTITSKFINQFSFSVDFQRDINKGDELEILYEANYTKNGNLVGEPSLLYAAMNLSNHKIELFRYKLQNGRIDFFDSTGKSIRKSIMRTPISGARLSSRFGMRKHPILGYSKMHRGVDFAARRGTPIMAAGDGRVTFAGRNGSYGKFIEIRHLNNFSTRYGHLHKFNKKIKKGKIVKQGDIIGFVGNTGRSTGSHLHYEVKHKNRIINPMTLKLPSRIKIQNNEMPNFYANVSLMRERLASTPLSGSNNYFAKD